MLVNMTSGFTLFPVDLWVLANSFEQLFLYIYVMVDAFMIIQNILTQLPLNSAKGR